MLLGELIDECIYDVAFEAHRNIKQANSICQICQTRSVSLSIECYPNVLIPFLGVDLMVRERKRMLWMKDVDFMLVSKPGCDVFGNTYAANNLPSYECVNCHKMIAAGRYAPHLEKCLGLAGRQSSRVANRR